MQPINIREYEELAQTRMDQAAWDYVQGGSDDEITLRENRAAYQRIRLRPRVLVDVSTIDMHTTVLGAPVSMPILVAPTGFHGLAHPEGECLTAQAAGEAGTLMGVSTFAHRSLEEIAQVASGPLWFQLYMYRNLNITGELVRRAQAADYRAIALTVDTPRLGNRERDLHHTLEGATAARVANLYSLEVLESSYLPKPIIPTWKTVEWLQSLTSLPILLKGILTAEDAVLAVEHGVQGIIVSNHGGRQLDTALSTIEALPSGKGNDGTIVPSPKNRAGYFRSTRLKPFLAPVSPHAVSPRANPGYELGDDRWDEAGPDFLPALILLWIARAHDDCASP